MEESRNTITYSEEKWQGWRDSNPQPSVLETAVLPIRTTPLARCALYVCVNKGKAFLWQKNSKTSAFAWHSHNTHKKRTAWLLLRFTHLLPVSGFQCCLPECSSDIHHPALLFTGKDDLLFSGPAQSGVVFIQAQSGFVI